MAFILYWIHLEKEAAKNFTSYAHLSKLKNLNINKSLQMFFLHKLL